MSRTIRPYYGVEDGRRGEIGSAGRDQAGGKEEGDRPTEGVAWGDVKGLLFRALFGGGGDLLFLGGGAGFVLLLLGLFLN
jgi:hypothetical protein